MPVLVTGAESGAGRAAVRALLRAGGEVRVFLDAERSGDEEAAVFRRMGCKAAVGTYDDEAHLETALEQVHTVVHLHGGPLEDPDEQLEALATVTSAAIGASCRRLVWATELAVNEPGDNPYLRAQAEAQSLLCELPMETVVLRCALRYGPQDAFTRALAGTSLADVDESARHAPLFLGDLADAIAVADRQRESAAELRVAVELVGPDDVKLGDFLARLRATVTGPLSSLPAWVAPWLSQPATGGPEALGREGTPLDQGLQLSS